MSTNITKLLDKYLKSKFDIDHSIYKAFISNAVNTPPASPTDPSNLDIGAIANTLEWVRLLSKGLQNQLDLTLANTKYLNLIIQDHVGIVRADGESDSDYLDRAVDYMIAPKVSVASIIYHTIPYSSPGPPQIIDGTETAFADVSFSDNYSEFQNLTPGSPEYGYYIFPALAAESYGGAYFFVLQLENTAATDIPAVVDLVNRWIAAGIRYEIQIVSV